MSSTFYNYFTVSQLLRQLGKIKFLYIFDSLISQIIDIERISITCNYLFIIALVVTAFCFTQILKFVDEDRIYDYLNKDALRSLIKRSKDFQIANCSLGMYSNVIDINYSLMLGSTRDYEKLWFCSCITHLQASNDYERYVVKDVYIERLKWLLKKLRVHYPEQIICNGVSLNKELYNNVIFYMKSEIPYVTKYLNLLSKCFKVIGVSKSMKRQDCWEFITNELLEKTRDGDFNRISQILDIQLMIYRKYFEVVRQNV